MKRGWRNDPTWVAYYEKRDRERAERRMAIVRAEVKAMMEEATIDAQLRRMHEKQLSKIF